jgi:hypothetical protein
LSGSAAKASRLGAVAKSHLIPLATWLWTSQRALCEGRDGIVALDGRALALAEDTAFCEGVSRAADREHQHSETAARG